MPLATHWLAWNLSGGLRQEWNWMHRGSLPNSLPAEVSQLDVCLWQITGSPGTLAGASYVNSWIHRHTAVPETLAAAGGFHVARLFGEVLTGGGLTASSLAAAGELHVARLFGEVLTGGGLTASSLAAAGELHVARLFGEVLTGGGLTASSGVSYVNSWIHRHTAVPETLAAAGGFHVARLFGEVLTGGGLTASSLAGASGSGGIPCIQSLWEKPDPTHCLAHKLSGDGKTLAAARELDASRLFAEVLTGGGLTASSLAAAGELHVARLFGEVLTGGGLTASWGVSYVNSWIYQHTAVPETLAAAGELHVARLFGEVLTGGGLTASSGVSYVNSWIYQHTAVPETLAAAGELHVARLFGEVLTGGGLTASSGVSYVNSWIYPHTAVPETLAAVGEFHASRVCGTKPDPTHCLAHKLSGDGKTLAAARELDASRLFAELLTGGGFLAKSLLAEVSQLDVCLWRLTGSPETLAGVSYVNSWIHRHTAVPETLAAAGELHVARLFGEVLTGGGLTASSGVSYVNSWIYQHTAVPETLAAAGELHVARLFGEVLTGGGLTASSGVSYVNSWIYQHTAVPETLAAAGEFHASRVCGTKPDPTHCLAHKLSGDGKTLAAARELDASRLFAELLTGGAGASYVNSWIHRHTAVPETLAAAGELHVARLFGEVLTGGGLTASCMPLATHWLAWNLSGGLRQQGNWMHRGSLPKSLPAEVSQLDVCLWRITGSPGTLAGVSYRQQWNWMHRGSLPNSLPAEVSQLDVCLWRITGSPGTLAGASYVNSWIHRHTAMPETLAAAGEFHASRVCGTKPDPTHCLAHKLSGDGKTLAAARELDASRLFAELLTGGVPETLAAAGEFHASRRQQGNWMLRGSLPNSLPAEVSQLDVCLWRITGSPGTLAGVSYVNSWIHRHTAVPETLAAAGELHVARLFGEVLTGGGLTASSAAGELHVARLFAELLTGGGLTASCMPLATHWLAWNLSGGLRQQGNWMLRGSLPNSLPAEVSQLDVCLWRITGSPGTLAGVSGELHVARLFGEVLTGGGLTASCMPLANHWLAWNLSGGLRQQGNWMLRGSLPNSLPAEVSQLDVCLWRITGSPGTLAGASYVNSWIHRHTAMPETLAAAGEFHASRVCGTKPDPTHCLAHKLSGDGKTLAAARELDASRLFAELLTGGAGVSYVNSWIYQHTAVPETLAAAGELHVARLFGEVLTGGGLTASCFLAKSLPAEVSQLHVCLWRITGSPETLAGVSYVNSWIYQHTAVPETLAAAGELHVARLFGEVLTGGGLTASSGVSYVNSWIHRHTAVPETLAAAGEFHASRVCGTKPDPTHCLAHKLSGDGKTLAAARELDASRLFAELLTGGAGASYVNSWIHRHTAVPETLAAAGELHVARLFGEVLTGGGLTASCMPLATHWLAWNLSGGLRQQGNWMHRGSLPNSLPAEVSQLDVCLWRITGSPGTLAGVSGELHVARLFGEVLTGGGLTASCMPLANHWLAWNLSGGLPGFLAKSLPAEVSQLHVCLWRITGSPETLAGVSGELHVARLFGEVLTGGGLTASCMPLANHWLAWNLSGGLRQRGNSMHPESVGRNLIQHTVFGDWQPA
ncbi:hypothetical protein DFH06DRAFT_1130396 [Mycena polygramma]|nr:hypothetical protein DFH06DRAFT_1130396 [Mycena polygramma]